VSFIYVRTYLLNKGKSSDSTGVTDVIISRKLFQQLLNFLCVTAACI